MRHRSSAAVRLLPPDTAMPTRVTLSTCTTSARTAGSSSVSRPELQWIVWLNYFTDNYDLSELWYSYEEKKKAETTAAASAAAAAAGSPIQVE